MLEHLLLYTLSGADITTEHVNDPLMSLGVYFNKTDSTILHACKATEHKMSEDEKLKRQIDMVRQNLESPSV